MARVALLADRLRVEERLLIEAFAARGHEAVLVQPAKLALSPAAPSAGDFAVALDRGEATAERAVLAALLASGGTPVVNRAATARLLADRMALLRHLILAGIPVPETRVCFGEEAIFAAIAELGYPVVLKSLTVDPGFPVALVEDQDAAEAIVEHRIMLGGERAVLVQQFIPSMAGQSVRLVVAGGALAGIEQRIHGGWRPGRDAAYEAYSGDPAPLTALAERVMSRLGTGTYAVEVVETGDGPVVVGVANLVDFRSLSGRGVDVAGMIAEFVVG